MNYLKIKANDYNVIQMNNAAAICYNLDYDGDELNGMLLIN